MQYNQSDQLFTESGFTLSESEQIIDFNSIENFAQFDLPDDYKYYVLNYNAQEGFIGCEYMQLWSANSILELNKQYGIYNLLGIGSNGGGEFIAITPQKKIVLCPFIDMDSENYVEIGSSFSEMLTRLLNGVKWFN